MHGVSIVGAVQAPGEDHFLQAVHEAIRPLLTLEPIECQRFASMRPVSLHHAVEELREIVERTRDEEEEIYEIFEQYGVERSESKPVLEALKRKPQAWVDFMMRFELGLEEPQRNRASRSAITIALSYVVGGLVPLVPYMVANSLPAALNASVAITLVALLVFGGVKGSLTGAGTVRSAVQTVLIGGLAAGAAYLLARLLSAH